MKFKNFVFAAIFCFLYDPFLGLVGLLILRIFPTAKHPWCHRFGLRLLAMSTFLVKKYLPSKCRLDCENVNCGNWSCPRYAKQK